MEKRTLDDWCDEAKALIRDYCNERSMTYTTLSVMLGKAKHFTQRKMGKKARFSYDTLHVFGKVVEFPDWIYDDALDEQYERARKAWEKNLAANGRKVEPPRTNEELGKLNPWATLGFDS